MRLLPTLVIALVILGCGGGGPPSASISDPPVVAEPPEPVAVVPGSVDGMTLGLLSLERFGPKIVTAKVRIEVSEDAKWGGAYEDVVEDLGGGAIWPDDVSGMRLVDEVNGRINPPLFDEENRCLCSPFDGLRRGSTVDLYAKFAAPPEGITHVSLHVPGFPSFDEVRIDP